MGVERGCRALAGEKKSRALRLPDGYRDFSGMRRESMVRNIFTNHGVVKPSMRDRRINFSPLLNGDATPSPSPRLAPRS